VTPCAVCTVHVETRSAGFLVEPQNQGRWFVSGLASKPLRRFLLVWPQNRWRRFLTVWPQNQWRRFSPVWPQNWWRRFLPVWPQNRQPVSWLSLKTKVVEGFPVWASKPTALVWRFGPQNHRDDFLVWASKSSGLRFIDCATKPTEGRDCATSQFYFRIYSVEVSQV
jgi:hypothetical protein